ncbi:hypothetical protein C8J56DRAFT_1049729 [Mycena floridula]|nr:hypothetical protein C8J56DRAFT_1049729 [Mycena floridula]
MRGGSGKPGPQKSQAATATARKATKKKTAHSPKSESDYGEEIVDNNVDDYWQTPPHKKPGRSSKASAPSQADVAPGELQLSKDYGLQRDLNASKLATPSILKAIKNRKDLPDPDLQVLTPKGAQRLQQLNSNLPSSPRAQSLNPARNGSPVSRSNRHRSHSVLGSSSTAAPHVQPITAAEGRGRAVSRDMTPLPPSVLQQEPNPPQIFNLQSFAQQQVFQQQQNFSQFLQPSQNFQSSQQSFQSQQGFQQPQQTFQQQQQDSMQLPVNPSQPQANLQLSQQNFLQQPHIFNQQQAGSQQSTLGNQGFNGQPTFAGNQGFNGQPIFAQPSFQQSASSQSIQQSVSHAVQESFNQRPPTANSATHSSNTSASPTQRQSVAPPALSSSSAVEPADRDDDSDEEDKEPETSARRGRLSNAAREEIAASVEKMESEVSRLTKKHGCMPEYIWRQMRGKTFGPKNWNQMQTMLKHSETERRRWIDGYRPGMRLTATVASAAYTNFMNTMGDEDGEEYLDLRAREDALDPVETRQSRHRAWNHGFRLMKRTAERLETSVGMNVLLMAVADTVEEDHSLAEYFISPRLKQLVNDFFLVPPQVFLSIMKGSLYNAVSKEIFLEKMRAFLAAVDAVKPEPVTLSLGLVDDGDKAIEKEVRTLLIARAEKRKLNWPINQVPWSDMIKRCIDDGFQIIHWPDQVPIPGSKKKEDSKRGGFASAMGKTEKLRIRDALVDEEYRLDFVKVKASQVLDLKNSIIPYLSFGPPPHDSQQERGRRLFYNKPDDFSGPARCLGPAVPAAASAPAAAVKPAGRRARSVIQTEELVKAKTRQPKKKSRSSAALAVLDNIDDILERASFDPGTSDEEPDLVFSPKKLRARPVKLEQIAEGEDNQLDPEYRSSSKRPAADALESDHSAKRFCDEGSTVLSTFSDAPDSPRLASSAGALSDVDAASHVGRLSGTADGSITAVTPVSGVSVPSSAAPTTAASSPDVEPATFLKLQSAPDVGPEPLVEGPAFLGIKPESAAAVFDVKPAAAAIFNIEPGSAASVCGFGPKSAAVFDVESEPTAVISDVEPESAASVFDFEPESAAVFDVEPAAAIFNVESEPTAVISDVEPESAASVFNFEPESAAVFDVEPAAAIFNVEPDSATVFDVEPAAVSHVKPEPAALFHEPAASSATVFEPEPTPAILNVESTSAVFDVEPESAVSSIQPAVSAVEPEPTAASDVEPEPADSNAARALIKPAACLATTVSGLQ